MPKKIVIIETNDGEIAKGFTLEDDIYVGDLIEIVVQDEIGFKKVNGTILEIKE